MENSSRKSKKYWSRLFDLENLPGTLYKRGCRCGIPYHIKGGPLGEFPYWFSYKEACVKAGCSEKEAERFAYNLLILKIMLRWQDGIVNTLTKRECA
ncbi:hypothetical protein J4427_00285 [Candidatus Woesearchaeota archaeon]|nr:hypothetical protein [Candidatus Woesearchaeota archaeon]